LIKGAERHKFVSPSQPLTFSPSASKEGDGNYVFTCIAGKIMSEKTSSLRGTFEKRTEEAKKRRREAGVARFAHVKKEKWPKATPYPLLFCSSYPLIFFSSALPEGRKHCDPCLEHIKIVPKDIPGKERREEEKNRRR
jgi:hypothetical protein